MHFVFNTRDLAATHRSSWWRDQPLSELQYRKSAMDRARAIMPRELVCPVQYDEYVESAAGLQPLFRCLGEVSRFDRSRLTLVLAQRYSY